MIYTPTPSPNIIRVIKQRMRWARPVTRIGREEVLTGFWWET
jgi:hypothetical protein